MAVLVQDPEYVVEGMRTRGQPTAVSIASRYSSNSVSRLKLAYRDTGNGPSWRGTFSHSPPLG